MDRPVLTVAELAARLGGSCEGDGTPVITGVAGIRDARPGEVAFVANLRYAGDVSVTRAAAVIVAKAWDRPSPAALIRVDNPDAAFAHAASLFAPPPVPDPPGIHPSAVIAPDAAVGEGVRIGPFVVVEPGARIGARTVLRAHVYVGHEAVVGEDCRLYPNVSIRERCRIGARVILHNGCVVGSDGFGYTADEKGVRTKIPQLGIVVIGDDVELGANVTVDRARFGKTVIGQGVKVDNLVQIAHNVVIGDHAVIVAQVGIAGSSSIGARAVLAGQVGISGHLEVGEGAIIGAQAGVSKDVPAGAMVLGSPAMPMDRAKRIHAYTMRLPEMREQLLGLVRRVAELERRLPPPA
ncbi:MAG: UDP-3-O-(3-hydroxymyristoyl)glucosamine N-acyltransferase [Lentisphaerae bacterium]|nr:UDP-3-O-(3-hydroxymyristoyl)glucosamine N-acyltransferase [Lentisphaerota bacterium]